VALAGFGADLLRGSGGLPYGTQLSSMASHDALQGKQLESYLQSGTLPAGLQAGMDAAAASARASIRSEYAARGMSGSSAQAQDLEAVGEREAARAAQVAQQLFTAGLNESSQADQLYLALMDQQMQLDQTLANGVGNLAARIAGSSQPTYPGGQQQQAA